MSAEKFISQPLRSYDISFDSARALETQRSEQFISYISMQMETHLGERFNVALSRYEYDIKEGQLWGKDMEEPFIESLKRGRDYRLKHGNAVDWKREEAEVIGFEKIEKVLADENTPEGTMMLSISPPGLDGSSYQHNFYDIFVVRRKGERRYIEARRYASSLTPSEYIEKLSVFTPISVDTSDIASSFLANPISIQNTLTPEDIHNYLHKEYDFMTEAEFERVKKSCKALIEAYAKSVLEQPENNILHKTLYNAILNKADDVALNKEKEFTGQLLKEEVVWYASLPVREVMTGCGISGGYVMGLESIGLPFSVSAYSPDKYGKRTFNCPVCKQENIRPYNELLPRCLHCGSDKVAC